MHNIIAYYANNPYKLLIRYGEHFKVAQPIQVQNQYLGSYLVNCNLSTPQTKSHYIRLQGMCDAKPVHNHKTYPGDRGMVYQVLWYKQEC